jgi:hypothetical protein
VNRVGQSRVRGVRGDQGGKGHGAHLLVALLALSSVALTACGGGSGDVAPKLPLVDANCYSVGQVKPTQIVLACGDGNGVAQNLTWTRWDSQGALGSGDLNQNDCTPDCAEGHFVQYPATFRLSEQVTAAGRTYFTRVGITFSGATPAGKQSESVKDCFDTPPSSHVPRCPDDLRGGAA